MSAITAGLIVWLGFLFLMIKLPVTVNLRLLGHAAKLDLTISAVAYALHWGTFTGVMAAAVAGLLCSISTSFLCWAIGHIRGNTYVAGNLWDFSQKLPRTFNVLRRTRS